MDLFVARQPIFDTANRVVAYELLFRKGNHPAYDGDDGSKATEDVIVNSFLTIGLDVLTSGRKAFINFNDAGLKSGIAALLPADLLAVEILETVEPEAAVLAACRQLKKQGYTLVLDDFVFRPGYEQLIALADIIKVDFVATPPGKRSQVIAEFGDNPNLRFLAEKVETYQDFQEAITVGYTYFQGYFFSKPLVVARKGIPFTRWSAFKLLQAVHASALNIDQIELIIREEVAFSYQLFKFINSSSFGLRQEIRSIRHAIVLLGQRELRKWASLIALRNMGQSKPSELLTATLLRAHFSELVARQLNLGVRIANAFLTGLLSLLDAVIDRPMQEILKELPLDGDIKAALNGQNNIYRDILNLCIAYERAEWDEIFRCTAKLGIDEAELPGLCLNALSAAGMTDIKI